MFFFLVALYTDHQAAFYETLNDLVALGVQNVWICEVGSLEMYGSFENFKTMVLNSKVCNII